MQVSMKRILKLAQAKGAAIGAFNTPNLESVMGVISAAEEAGEPVILMHAHVHEPIIRIEVIAPIMLAAAERAAVPVCVHLDHGETLEYIHRALELGFNSVMYDGSLLSFEENAANTSMVVEMAARYGACVEGELGVVARPGSVLSAETQEGYRDSHTVEHSIYTEPEDARRFALETGVDALSCAFGTVHGLTKDVPRLDFERLKAINSLLTIPLVMHGGSGIAPEDYRKAIRNGIRKINYYSYMALAGGHGAAKILQSRDRVYFHEITQSGCDAIKADVKNAIEMFSGSGGRAMGEPTDAMKYRR